MEVFVLLCFVFFFHVTYSVAKNLKNKQSPFAVCLILLDTEEIEKLCVRELRTRASVAIILPVLSVVLEPSQLLPACVLPLHVRAPLSSHALGLLGYLLAVQVDAAVRHHGAGVSGGELRIQVRTHLHEGIGRGREVERQLILRGAASLSVAVLMAMLLLVFVCHLQFQ